MVVVVLTGIGVFGLNCAELVVGVVPLVV